MSIEDIWNEWIHSDACKKRMEADRNRSRKAAAKNAARSCTKKRKKRFDYKAYIASGRWAKKRTWIIRKRNSKCEYCESQKDLQVHHKTYARVGREKESDLLVLCRNCHATMHEDKGCVSDLSNAFLEILR